MLTKLRLNNFRNFSDKLVEFSPNTTVILGPNASGKTNILEAINLLAIGKSFKAGRVEEMINHEADIGRVKGRIQENTLEVVLTNGEIKQGNIYKKTSKKRLLVNNAGKRMIDFASHFQTVVFRPQDLDLITQSPSIRRRFLDNVLSLADREYYRSLAAYEKGITRRNKLLKKIREENIDKNVLTFWNNLLIKNGDYITKKRSDFLYFVNSTDQLEEKQLSVEYDSSTISEERLKQYERAEIASANTLVGPHRDDFFVKLEMGEPSKNRDLAVYGSRGQQRMGVLWLKLAELKFLEENLSQKPVLLLDDIFSELDHEHREIIENIMNNQQTIITAADPHYVENIEEIKLINLA